MQIQRLGDHNVPEPTYAAKAVSALTGVAVSAGVCFTNALGSCASCFSANPVRDLSERARLLEIEETEGNPEDNAEELALGSQEREAIMSAIKEELAKSPKEFKLTIDIFNNNEAVKMLRENPDNANRYLQQLTAAIAASVNNPDFLSMIKGKSTDFNVNMNKNISIIQIADQKLNQL